MPRSLGFIARAFLGLNGLLTVWCLGCCGFEPMLGNGTGAMAAPCSEEFSMAGPAAPSLPGLSYAVAVTTGPPDSGCACQSCCAVSSVRLAFRAAAPDPPAPPAGFAVALISTTQEPRYPPPKAPRWA